MFGSTVIFQRTHAGRTEIHEKKCGLTQSERLVLIMVDGASTFSGVRSKLPVLSDERFERAVRTLQQKELILEVFMPVADQLPEEVERTVVDRFLQQDPLDPVTIIMFEDDERLDWPAPPPDRPAPAAPVSSFQRESAASEVAAAVAPATGILEEPAREPSIETTQSPEFSPIPDRASEYARTPQAELDQELEPFPEWVARELEMPERSARKLFMENATFFYWGLTVAGAFVLGFAAARLTA